MASADEDVVRMLYQSVLGRDPDDEGMETNVKRMRDHPEGLAWLLEQFAKSPEAELRRMREKLHAPLTEPKASPYGPVNHVISLGTHCYTSALIKDLGLKRQSFPFDWLFSSERVVLDCLENDFSRFLDREYFRTTDIESREEPEINLCDHEYYAENFGVRHLFNHRDPNEEEHYEYYRRTVERFRRVLESDDVKLLVMIDSMRGISRDVFLAISRELLKRGNNVIFEAIEVVPGTGDVLSLGMKSIASNGHHRLTRYSSTSPIDALAFVNPLDDAVLRNAVTQFEMRLAA